ncbi:DUF664 domain-containing protein [uncultured Pseudokineococcus sp.]|uniref:mycothiol transferase n=1 Tax=uncultured Pseudokineococcus sp. TaxID=1642928 RepID=UPI002634BAC3|nr:DUF664 domain-containing protein [uncultured Pseudokineococcus sp.]
MDVSQLLQEVLGRASALAPTVVDGLSEEDLARAPQPGANTVAWLVWHQARVMDDHLADAAGLEQVWTTPTDGDGGRTWADRLALDLPREDTGYGHTADEVARVRASAEDLAGYARAVGERADAVVAGLGEQDLDRVVDEAWDPPVTYGVRLASVASDCLQHLGQASYVRGLLGR